MLSSVNPDLRKRIQWGLPAAILTITIIFAGGPEASFLTALVCGLQAWKEYARMMNFRDRVLFHFGGYALIFSFFNYTCWIGSLNFGALWLTWVLGFAFLYLEMRFFPTPTRNLEFADPLDSWTVLSRFVVGILYVFLIFGFIGPLVSKPNGLGQELLLLTFASVFVGDSGAYLVGKKFGKRKLWPALSPKKTVEGALGGFVASVFAALVTYLAILFLTPREALGIWTCLGIGALAAPLAQAADLMESVMKRVGGRKDS